MPEHSSENSHRTNQVCLRRHWRSLSIGPRISTECWHARNAHVPAIHADLHYGPKAQHRRRHRSARVRAGANSGARARTDLTKLGLFNPAYVPFDDFIYFDLSLVIRANLDALLAFTWAREEALVIVKDWYYDGFNSSVMRIRNEPLRFIYDEFAGQGLPGESPGRSGITLRLR